MKKLFYAETNHGPTYVSAPSAEAALANTPGAYQVRPVEDVEHQPYKYPETFAAFNIRTLSFHARNTHFPDQMLIVVDEGDDLSYLPVRFYDSVAFILFTLHENPHYRRLFRRGRITFSATLLENIKIQCGNQFFVLETAGFPIGKKLYDYLLTIKELHIYWEVPNNG